MIHSPNISLLKLSILQGPQADKNPTNLCAKCPKVLIQGINKKQSTVCTSTAFGSRKQTLLNTGQMSCAPLGHTQARPLYIPVSADDKTHNENERSESRTLMRPESIGVVITTLLLIVLLSLVKTFILLLSRSFVPGDHIRDPAADPVTFADRSIFLGLRGTGFGRALTACHWWINV